MFKAVIRTLLLALASAAGEASAADGVVVIGNANLRRIDANTIAKIYTGKVIEVDGVAVTAINANSGSAVRNRFLQVYLQQDEDKYTAYWTVRRYIGKGVAARTDPERGRHQLREFHAWRYRLYRRSGCAAWRQRAAAITDPGPEIAAALFRPRPYPPHTAAAMLKIEAGAPVRHWTI